MNARKASKQPKPRLGKSRKRQITAGTALRMAAFHVVTRLLRGATVRDGKTARGCVYDPSGKLALKDVWLVYPNPERPATELRSSKVIVICKRTGRVLYEGSAHDEG